MHRWLMLVLLLSLAQRAAASEPAPITLRWQVERGCPDAAAAQAMAARVGAPVRVAALATFTVQITRVASGRYAARIESTQPGLESERSFEGDDCARVAEAALLVVAIAAHPLLASSQLSEQMADARPARSTSLYPALQGVLDTGSLPQLSVGAGLLLGYQRGHGRLEGGLLAFLPRSSQHAGLVAGVEVGLYSGLVRGCAELPWLGARLGACGALELGLSTGQGVGVKAPRAVHGLWSAGWLGLRVQPQRTSGFFPAAQLELGLPIARPRFDVLGEGTVYRASALLLRAALSLNLDLF